MSFPRGAPAVALALLSLLSIAALSGCSQTSSSTASPTPRSRPSSSMSDMPGVASGDSTAAAADKMDASMTAVIKSFPAKTQGLGGPGAASRLCWAPGPGAAVGVGEAATRTGRGARRVGDPLKS